MTPIDPFDPPPEALSASAPEPLTPQIPEEPSVEEPSASWADRLRAAWSWSKGAALTVFRWVVRYPAAILAAALFLVGVSLWATWRRGDLGRLNVGGVLGWLFHGSEDPPTVTRAKVVVLPAEPGAPANPATQAEILPSPGGPLRDKTLIRIKEEDGAVRDVRLPKGVREEDVREVLEVAPGEVKLRVIRRPDHNITEDDLRHLLIVLLTSAAACLTPLPLWGQECPAGFKCVPEEVAARQAAALREYMCLQNSAGPLISLNPVVVSVMQDGTVALPPSVAGTLKWCAWEYELEAPLKVTVASKPAVPAPAEPDWGFVPRWRAGLLLAPLVALRDDAAPDSAWEPALLFQAFHFRLVHLNAHAGWRSGGLGVGVDLTRNLDLSAGVGLRWATWAASPFLGLSLALY